MLANGRAKLERKGVDAVVVNDVAADGLGFDSPRNAGIFLKRDGAVEIPAMTKTEMAGRILDEIGRLRLQSPRVGSPA
jgi:phosphopantothenoylcysteine decarboxylase/phosphopantothenate--cysteine ligase